MQFDFKITTWERIEVSEEFEQEVLDGIKDGSITNGNGVFNVDENAECNTIDEVEEYMSLEDNGGASTIEVLEDGKTIYENGE